MRTLIHMEGSGTRTLSMLHSGNSSGANGILAMLHFFNLASSTWANASAWENEKLGDDCSCGVCLEQSWVGRLLAGAYF